jgi:hypothetical protein
MRGCRDKYNSLYKCLLNLLRFLESLPRVLSILSVLVFSVAGIRMNETADCETENANNSRGVLKKSEIEVDLSSDDWTTFPTLLR